MNKKVVAFRLKEKLVALLFLLNVFGAVYGTPQTQQTTTYTIHDSSSVTVKCDPPDSGIYDYEWRIIDLDRGSVINLQRTLNSQITITRPRSGHYSVQVRVCYPGSSEDSDCSRWIDSRDSSSSLLEDGTPGAWLLFWKPLPPGPIHVHDSLTH